MATPGTPRDEWWRSAVTYQVYLRSFADGNGDGIGDLAGLRDRLDHVAALGVDALWLNPWYPSPQADAGYDVADYRAVEPLFGDLDAGLALVREAHDRGLRVLLDVVPNHTSDEHPWFRAALAAAPGSPERARYHFLPGRGPGGDEPPTDWPSMFGGPAWTRVTEADGSPGEWYLHLFDVKQPDVNWGSEEVRAEHLDVLRFWFDRGVDGFRIDVAHGLVKQAGYPDLGPARPAPPGAPDREDHPYWDRPGVHDVFRSWRAVADSYDPPKVFVAEAWVTSPERLAAYLRSDELHTAFTFDLLRSPWSAAALRRAVDEGLAANTAVGAPVTWVLSNHDVVRQVTRLGRPDAAVACEPLARRGRPAVDLDLGRRRARAALLLELALPGCVYLYQGEELGLEEVEDLPDALRQDPTFERTGGADRGRDGCRVPLPWRASGPSLGFGPRPGWLPQPEGWRELAAEVQAHDPGSVLSLYRRALAERRARAALGPDGGGLRWLEAPEGVLAFVREHPDGDLTCVVNTTAHPVALPPGEVVLGSLPEDVAGTLPGDAAAWLVARG